jgi:hypothetical protein
MLRKLLILLIVTVSIAGCKKTIEEIFGLENDKPVGASANDLLSGSKYHSLKVEVQYMPGFAPDAAAVSHLQGFLSERLNKPGSITITTKEIPASASTTLSLNDVVNIEKANRTGENTSTEINVYILYTNGQFTSDNVLGIAYRNTSAAIFGKKIHDNSGGLGQASRTKLEATVLEHEVGHLLGLVNIGTPMQTNHQGTGNHCNNQSCLMYHAAETTDILGFLITGNIPTLDQNCINDLKANGGK